MAHDSEQKIKLLILYDILCRLTDETHALNADELIDELATYNIKASRRVLPADIALLNQYGYEVMSYKKKFYYYYVVNRHFDSAEISMLADVVKASKLSSGQKVSLINKLSKMVGDYQAEKSLSKHIINCDTPKRTNSHIIYSIDAIDRALSERKKVSFLYYSLDAKKNKVYRKDGKRYFVNPLVMVWNKDNYYLISYYDNHEGTVTYRIDRMESVQVEETDLVEKAEFANFDIENYRSQVFSMFGGELRHVDLQFVPEMLGDIYDKFGEDVKVQENAEGMYIVRVPIQISPNFFSWVVGSRGKVRILRPCEVCDQFDEFVQQIKEEY